MNRPPRQAGYSLLELLITLAIIGVIAAIALPMYSEALLRAHISSGINDAYSLQMAFKRYHVDNSAYPADGSFDVATFEPLVSMGYYDGRNSSRFLNDKADGYDAPDDLGVDQEYWLEFTLAYDPTVRFLVSDSDNAPLGGGSAHYEGIFMFRNGVLKPL